MSLSQKSLSTIQKAGQAIHAASETIAVTVRIQAESMVAGMAAAPFSAESEQAIARFKTLSQLSHGLAAVEAQLQALFATACELANPASDVIVLPSISKRKSVSNAAAVDVVAKPAKAAKSVKAKQTKKAGRKAATLTANDTKLLQYLQGVLKSEGWTTLTGVAIAKEADMPLGSVGLSLKKILATGAVKSGGRGLYQLGATAAVPVVPVVKNAPAKRAKPVATKPAAAKKAKAPKAEAPAAEAEAAPV